MINNSTVYGSIIVSESYIKQLIATTLTTCYGVSGTQSYGIKGAPVIKKFTKNKTSGIIVTCKDNKLCIDVNIVCVYGVNISTITSGVVKKINTAVFDNLNIVVDSIKVHVANVAV